MLAVSPCFRPVDSNIFAGVFIDDQLVIPVFYVQTHLQNPVQVNVGRLLHVIQITSLNLNQGFEANASFQNPVGRRRHQKSLRIILQSQPDYGKSAGIHWSLIEPAKKILLEVVDESDLHIVDLEIHQGDSLFQNQTLELPILFYFPLFAFFLLQGAKFYEIVVRDENVIILLHEEILNFLLQKSLAIFDLRQALLRKNYLALFNFDFFSVFRLLRIKERHSHILSIFVVDVEIVKHQQFLVLYQILDLHNLVRHLPCRDLETVDLITFREVVVGVGLFKEDELVDRRAVIIHHFQLGLEQERQFHRLVVDRLSQMEIIL